MGIHIRTIEKLAAEAFKNDLPLVIIDKDEQTAFLENLKKQLNIDEKWIMHISNHKGWNDKKGHYVGLSIRLKTPDGGYGFAPEIQFNLQNELVLTYYSFRKEYYCASSHTFLKFLEQLFELYKVAEQNQRKVDKINALKMNSIVAKVKEIAQEDDFEYACHEEATKVNLMIKLSNRDALIIHVPYKNFQDVMQQIRPIIKTIRELTKSGITFKIKGFGYTIWDKPEK